VPSRIKAVTIDFWQTLYIDTPQRQAERLEVRVRKVQNILAEAGIRPEAGQIETVVRAAAQAIERLWLQRAEAFTDRMLADFLSEHLQLSDGGLAHRLVEALSEAVPEVPPALAERAVEGLRTLNRQVPLGLVSDTALGRGRHLRRLMEKDGILEYFSACVFSDELGVTKPRPEAFLAALNKMGCQPQEAIHIGDLEPTDILGAKTTGMLAVKVTSDGDRTLADWTARSFSEAGNLVISLLQR